MFRSFSLVASRQVNKSGQQCVSRFSNFRLNRSPYTRQQRNSGNSSYTGDRFQKEENAKEREFINREDAALIRKFRQQQGKDQPKPDAKNPGQAKEGEKKQTTQPTSFASKPSEAGTRTGYGNVQYNRHQTQQSSHMDGAK